MAVTICDVSRVVAVLRTSMDEAERIQPTLDATIEWVQRVYNGAAWGLDAGQVITEKFYNRRSNEVMTVSDEAPTGVSVKLFPRTEGLIDSIYMLQESNFQVLEFGRIQLLISDLVAVPGVEFAYQKVARRGFREVDITYTTSGIVPKSVTEAIALIAAAAYQQQPVDISGMKSEHIGGYSYEIDPEAIGAVPEAARRYLRPFTRHQRARMI